MLKMDILIKIITLLHREHLLGLKTSNENSNELVNSVLKVMDSGKQTNGGEGVIIEDLKRIINDMLKYPDNFDKESLLQSLNLVLRDNTNILSTIQKAIDIEMSTAGLKRSIVSLRNTLTNYHKEKQLSSLISSASYDILTNRLGNQSLHDYVSKLITNLEALTTVSKGKDVGVVDEIDISSEDEISSVIDKVKEQKSGTTKLITGWKELNRMIQGGFHRGEMVMINALQHKYKSGFVRSVFMQLCMHNKPVLEDKTKKPLMLYISFEDNIDITLEFMYTYLWYNEHEEIPDMTLVKTADVAKYIREKLTATGYNIKIVRVNPSEWTYKDIFNKILKYEAEGYEIHSFFLDYLAKLPTTGCITGPAGADYKDLFTRMYNFMSSKKILFITPHQLSTEAKQLIRNGEPDISFVKAVQGKGYFDNSKALDQIVDLELYLHIATVKRKKVLTVARGKHRRPTILEDDAFFFTLPFPKNAPIKENINDEDTESIDTDEEEFDF